MQLNKNEFCNCKHLFLLYMYARVARVVKNAQELLKRPLVHPLCANMYMQCLITLQKLPLLQKQGKCGKKAYSTHTRERSSLRLSTHSENTRKEWVFMGSASVIHRISASLLYFKHVTKLWFTVTGNLSSDKRKKKDESFRVVINVIINACAVSFV